MQNFLQIINSAITSQELLLLTELVSFSFKVFLTFALINLSIRKSISKKLLLLLIGVLVGSMFYSDLSWIPTNIRKIYWPSFDNRITGLMGRLGWAFFVVQNQALTLLLENLIERTYVLSRKQKIFLCLSSALVIVQLYFAIFQFNEPHAAGMLLTIEQSLVQIYWFYLILLLIPSVYKTISAIRSNQLPKILSYQLKTFLLFLILPHLFLELITNKLLLFSNLSKPLTYTILSVSTMLISYALYYCCKRMLGLRFLNFKNHVEAKEQFNFINDFKDILEQLSYVTSLKEIAHLTQIFFKSAFTIPIGRTRFYVRKTEHEDLYGVSQHHDLLNIAQQVETFLHIHDKPTDPIAQQLQQIKIFIKDEIEFTNFYEETKYRNEILNFLDVINADVFLPIYERHVIVAYIIVERNARFDQLYNSTERDEMLVFTNYLSNIINILKHSNLEELLKREKELKEELYHKHQEINQYKESIRSFLKTNRERKIGIVFYKNRKFIPANQAAQELITIDLNTSHGHPVAQTFKETARLVEEYKSPQTVFAKDAQSNRLVLAALPSLDDNTVIILIYYPEVSDIIKSHFELLKDPSSWDYLLYLETTQSGQLINQLIPGTSETLLHFKIQLLSTALSKKATLIDMPEDDLMATVEILHHISLRQTLHTIKLTSEEKNNDVAMKLFGINPLMQASSVEPLLEKLDNIGTLFIENIHLLSLETQNYLAEFIAYGFFHKFKSDHKIFSNVRIIASSQKNLQHLVTEGLFSKTLFNELKKTTLSLPSLSTLTDPEIAELAQGYTQQALKSSTLKNLLDLSDKDTSKILHERPVSLHELKTKVQNFLMTKSTKQDIHDKTEFDPAYHITNPEIARAVRLGKKALKDAHMLSLLWDTFKNQNKIATLLGVNRSSVNRRLQQYNMK